MIKLTKLFTPTASLDGEEAKKFLNEHPEGSYTLLDVRQPWEYEEEHLPGARLIPLAELKDAVPELDPAKPTLVYCAVGGRSRVGAQLLSGFGFEEVYNLAGGIKGYQGVKASGPQELNLDLVRGDESPPEMLRLAYGMEKALQAVYRTVQEQSADKELTHLLGQLARIEENHKHRIFERFQALAPEAAADAASFDAAVTGDIMEGGYRVPEFLQQNRAPLATVSGVLELAMMLETQALDLYLRFAHQSTDQGTREVLLAIAEEEKAHVAALGRLLDRKP